MTNNNMSETTGYDAALAQLERARQRLAQGALSEALAELQALTTLLATESDDSPLKNVYVTASDELYRLHSTARERVEQVRAQMDAALAVRLSLPEAHAPFDPAQPDRYLAHRKRDVNDLIANWTIQIGGLLSAWQDALLGGVPDLLTRYQDTYIPEYIELQRGELHGQAVQEVCQRLWTTAEQQIRESPDSSPGAIQNYYDRASELARKERSEASGKVSAIELVFEQAEKRRAAQALANQVFTSAVQGEFYRRSLAEVRSLEVNQQVPYIEFVEDGSGNMREIQRGWVPTGEAIRRLTEQARVWAHGKATIYYNRAQEFLTKEHNPRAALGELDRQADIDPFLDDLDRADFKKVRDEAEPARKKYDQAETRAKQARALIQGDPLAAWRVLKEAATLYGWADEVQAVSAELSTRLEQLLDEAHARQLSALDALNFTEIDRIRRDSAKYSLPELPNTRLKFEQLEQLSEQAHALSLRLDAASIELTAIQRQATADPVRARERLTGFLTDFQDVANLYADHLKLNDVRTSVLNAGDATEEFARLEGLLISNDLAAVSSGVENAQTDVARFPRDTRFQSILNDLIIHRLFLEAERAFTQQQYDQALPKYRTVSAERAHRDAGRAASRSAEIDRFTQEDAQITQQLERAYQKIYADPADPVGAFKAIKVLTIRGGHLAAQRERYLTEARNQAQIQLEPRLQAMQAEAAFNLERVKSALADLQTVGLTTDYEQWSSTFKDRILAGEARALPQQTPEHLEQVIKKWREALDTARTSGRAEAVITGYEEALGKARKAVAELRLAQMRVRMADTRDNNEVIQAEAGAFQTELEALQADYSTDPELALWLAALYGTVAQYSDNPTRRREFFVKMGTMAEAVGRLAGKRADWIAQAKTLQQDSIEGERLSNAMASIQEKLQRRPTRLEALTAAVRIWRSEVEPSTKRETFAPLTRWWVGQRREIATDLEKKLHTEVQKPTDDIGLTLLRLRAGLLLMQDNESRSEIDELPLLATQYKQYVDQMRKDLARADGVSGSGQEKLDLQLSAAQTLAEALQTLIEFKDAFTDDPRFTVDELEAAAQNATAHLGILRSMVLDPLELLGRNLAKIREQLNKDKQTGNFAESERLLAAAAPAEHPVLKQLRAAITHSERERTLLDGLLTHIRGLLEAEQYEDANTQLAAIEDEAVDEFGFDTQFSFKDKASGRMIRGWDGIRSLVQKQIGLDARIVHFAERFDDYSAGQGRYTGRKAPSKPSLDWPDIKAEIIRAGQQGQFDAARQRLDQVLGSADVDGKLSLSRILDELARPPGWETAATDPDLTQQVKLRYEAASTHVISQRAKDTLAYLLERWQTVRDEIETARQLHDKLDQAESGWAQGYQTWEHSILEAASLLNQTEGLVGSVRLRIGGLKGSLRSAVNAAKNGYERCVAASAQHPILADMYDPTDPDKGLWVYRHAARLAGIRL